MKALKTLIRLAKEEVEIARRALAEAEALHRRARERIADLEAGIVSEQKEAAANALALSTYGAYAAARAEDRRVLTTDETAYSQHAAVLRERLAEAHVELKKLERLAELQAERESEAERKRDLAELDEIATARAARKES
ncbi:MAG: flagellar FliJ family protein [Hyphomonadaceae bacterium]